MRPVGSEREVPVDLRFIFATNADLEKAVEEGRFRSDLFYRLNVMHIDMPPLRDRGDDVIELADLFMEKLSAQLGMPRLDSTSVSPKPSGAMTGRAMCANCAISSSAR